MQGSNRLLPNAAMNGDCSADVSLIDEMMRSVGKQVNPQPVYSISTQ